MLDCLLNRACVPEGLTLFKLLQHQSCRHRPLRPCLPGLVGHRGGAGPAFRSGRPGMNTPATAGRPNPGNAGLCTRSSLEDASAEPRGPGNLPSHPCRGTDGRKGVPCRRLRSAPKGRRGETRQRETPRRENARAIFPLQDAVRPLPSGKHRRGRHRSVPGMGQRTRRRSRFYRHARRRIFTGPSRPAGRQAPRRPLPGLLTIFTDSWWSPRPSLKTCR